MIPASTTSTTSTTSTRDDITRAAAVRHAQRTYGSCSGERRSNVLWRLAALLEATADDILAANAEDLRRAAAEDLPLPLLRRLELTDSKLLALRRGVEQLAASTDPIGEVMRRTELDEGLMLTQVKSPLGVLLIIFESRPDAVIQIGSLALRSGNGVILKGGREARCSNEILVSCLRRALWDEGHAEDVVLGVEGRQAVHELLQQDHLIDLVIPRGSGELVRAIQNSTAIPVLGHAEGVCHMVLDKSADVVMAQRLVVDSKCDYPAACNAAETLLVHREFLPQLPAVGAALLARGVTLRADARSLPYLTEPGAVEVAGTSTDPREVAGTSTGTSTAGVVLPATADDWGREYGDLVLAVATVDTLDEAIDHIHAHGSGHTEAVVTEDAGEAERFLRRVDSASVFVNASTRFADGYRYGLGAEVGISTGRIHARGPVGVDGLLTSRWLLRGDGQGVAEYGDGGRAFLHRRLV